MVRTGERSPRGFPPDPDPPRSPRLPPPPAVSPGRRWPPPWLVALAEAEFVLELLAAVSGGRKRNAAAGIFTALSRRAMTMETFAVMPGLSLRSALFTSTT